MKKAPLVAAALAVASLLAPAAAPASGPAFSCSGGAAGVARLDECAVTSPALGGETVGLRVLKPNGYRATGAPHPVLLLLHGCCSSLAQGHELWTTPENGNAQQVAAGSDFIIVMPAGDHHGWYTNWNAPGGPRWEDHHLQEVLPWVEATYNATTSRDARFVAGLSMGGYGAMAYAARHPDLFRGAASWSGAVDIMLPGATMFIHEQLNSRDDVWGDPMTHEVGWRGHNPVDLATNLRPLDLIYLSAGAGVPAQEEARALTEDGRAPSETNIVFEAGTNRMSHNLADALTAAGIGNEMNDYVLGTHIWHYWRIELAAILPRFEALAATAAAPLGPFDYRSTEPAFEAFGWDVSADASRAPEFLDVTNASAAGVTLTGSGTTAVTTGPLFAPGQTVTLGGAVEPSAVAGADGRISFTADLGPAHTAKQFSPEARAAEVAALPGSRMRTVTVTFS